MKRQLMLLLMLIILGELTILPQANAAPYTWVETFNYTSLQQMQSAGWTLENPTGTSLTPEGLVIDGTGADTVVRYLYHFPADIYDWNVTTRSKWTGTGHSGPGVSIVTEKHSYSIFADGWYSHYAFGRDGQNTIFGTYSDQQDVWITMSIVKTGSNISVYSNGEQIYSTTESDPSPSALIGVDRIAPWRGIMVYNHYSVTAPLEVDKNVDTWAPEPANVIAAATIVTAATVTLTAAAPAIAAIVNSTGGTMTQGFDEWLKKIYDNLPDAAKSWLEEYVSSKNKTTINERKANPYMLQREEAIAYAFGISLMTAAYSYSTGYTLEKILANIPAILATSILFALAKNYLSTVISRRNAVWTEHRIWPLGTLLFTLSSLILRVPFSSPSRLERSDKKEDKRTAGLLSSASILITMAFAGIFYLAYSIGWTLIGSVGVIMCLTSALFDSLPVPPMSGRHILLWDKRIWIMVFGSAIILFASAVEYF